MSLNLTLDEQEFILKHEIPLSQLFDARGKAVGGWRDIMKQVGAIIAFNTTPCQSEGHRMRTRRGHCVMCDPAKIAYMRRHEDPGFVYVAISRSGKLVKIGTTADVADREKRLNGSVYGGQNDWRILYYRYCGYAGRHEFLLQQELAAYRTSGWYFHDGHMQDCHELFSCKEKVALEAFKRIVPDC